MTHDSTLIIGATLTFHPTAVFGAETRRTVEHGLSAQSKLAVWRFASPLQASKGWQLSSLNAASDNSFDYISHSNQGHTGNYFMAIDTSCQLFIFEGTFECNEIDIDKEIWSSDKYGPWEIEDALYKGQIYHGLSWYEVVLNPYDGNLEVRNPQSHGTYDIVWQASDEWAAPPGDHLHDFYAKLKSGGRLILVGIDYQNGMKQEEYFSKRLDTGGADCFTLGFEVKTGEDPYGVSDPIDLIAVPCE